MKFTRNEVHILVKKGVLTLESSRQFHIGILKEERIPETFCDHCGTLTIPRALICCNARRNVDSLADQMSGTSLCQRSMQEPNQKERDLIISEFRSGSSGVLISTDLHLMPCFSQLDRVIAGHLRALLGTLWLAARLHAC